MNACILNNLVFFPFLQVHVECARADHRNYSTQFTQVDLHNHALTNTFLTDLNFITSGAHHFQYMDQPWAPDDHLKYRTNYGIVSINDTEYTELVNAMRASNAVASTAHASGVATQRCASDSGSWSTGVFRGNIAHSASREHDQVGAQCLTALGLQEVALGPCGKDTEWVQLASGALQHVSTGRCLDLDRGKDQSPAVILTANCSASTSYELPSAWEHGADCLVMNFCRWLGNPVCGYGQTCLSVAPGGKVCVHR